MAGLAPHADALPARLSRGMRQRLAVARALIHDPPLLLLDEPFTSLDAAGAEWLLTLLTDLRDRGRTICFVTHEQEKIRCLAQRVLELREGKVYDVTATQGGSSLRYAARHDTEAIVTAQIWWIIQKDLVSEWRSRRAWPAMILLGIVVAVVFSVQMDLPAEYQRQMAASLLWVAIFFAATLSLDRSFALEREDGCWQALLLYPVSPSSMYLAKLAVNVVWLAPLQCVLIPLFVVLTDVPLLGHPWAMALVALLGNVGIASAGTLLSALATRSDKGTNLTVLLALPMAIPVVLAAAEATRLLAEGRLDGAWWDWNVLLAAFAAIFIVAGMVLMDFVAEE